ncbi:MAG: ChaN family lipoprotein [Cyanobium sp.]
MRLQPRLLQQTRERLRCHHAPIVLVGCRLPWHWLRGLAWRIGAPALILLGPVQGLTVGEEPPPPSCAAATEAERQQQAQLLQRASRGEVDGVLLGEHHTSAADHGWQLRTLGALAQRKQPLILGLEMVPAPRQLILNRFSSGQLDGASFLKVVDWAAIWGHDAQLYLPLLRWAKGQGVPLLALNVEPAVVRRVRREGLAAMPPPEREGIGDPTPARGAYRQRLQEAWQAHNAMGAGGIAPAEGDGAKDLERFIDSQLLRDRAMAEHLARAQRRNPQRLVVALIGLGHLEGDGGVPFQLRDLGLKRWVVLQRPEPPGGCDPPPPGVRLGAYLESADGAVWVRRVAPGSAAEAAGLRPGDRVLMLNGEPVERAGQVILRVRELPPGVPLRLLIERAGKRRLVEVRLAPGRGDSPGRMG